MTSYSSEYCQKVFDTLPKDLQDAITSIDTTTALQEIGSKNNLLLDKQGELGSEVGYVMMGLTKTKDFVRNLQNRLGVNLETANSIAKDVNDKIFLKIRESLRQAQEKQVEQDQAETINDLNEELNKDEIMKGIEDPVKTFGVSGSVLNKSSAVMPPKPQQVRSFNQNQNNSPASPTKEQNRGPFVEAIPVNILESKLTSTVQIPSQSENLIEKKKLPPVPENLPTGKPKTPAKYTVDPYREPIN